MKLCIDNIFKDEKFKETSFKPPFVKVSSYKPLDFDTAFLCDVLFLLFIHGLFHGRQCIFKVELGLKAAPDNLSLVLVTSKGVYVSSKIIS